MMALYKFIGRPISRVCCLAGHHLLESIAVLEAIRNELAGQSC